MYEAQKVLGSELHPIIKYIVLGSFCCGVGLSVGFGVGGGSCGVGCIVGFNVGGSGIG
jgi:hypothetical protein